MTAAWAEVIGDPVAQSKSPVIHRHWLEALGIEGDFLKTRVEPPALGSFFAGRRARPDWRGCSVTIPHKLAVIPHLDALDPSATATGAVNCVRRDGPRLIGANTDVEGVAAALEGWSGGKAVLIGAGGAARAALEALRRLGAGPVAIIARDRTAGSDLLGRFRLAGEVHSFAEAGQATIGARLIINASPLGMKGMAGMPGTVLDALAKVEDDARVFDMVYAPVETELLRRAGSMSLGAVTGLTMLVGQARAAFGWFFGAEPPKAGDDVLMRALGE
jgi:shikimate dehydrogenase